MPSRDVSWASFVATHWERQATVLRQPLAEPVTTPARLWPALLEVSDRVRARDASVRLELYVEHTMMLVHVGDHLPMASDGSIEGWATRLRGLLGGRTFGLVVTDIQVHEPLLWRHLHDALRGLFAHTGVPASAKATLFLGDYPSTPFGLHRGNAATLVFAVHGPKRIRVWPDAYFAGRADPTSRLDYRAYEAASTVLDARPGDVIYWPSDHWHIGEGVDGLLSAAVSVHVGSPGTELEFAL